MGYREPFTLYPRKANKGKIIWYYRTYDEFGNRTSGKSTGQTSKAAAKHYVVELIKKGALVTKGNPTFSKYAKNWWIWDKCSYVKRRIHRGKSISRDYTDIMRGYLTKHIFPYFNDVKLQNITAKMIEDWIFKLRETPGKNSKPISHSTVNHVLTCLKIMLKEAVRLGYLHKSPGDSAEQLTVKVKEKNILTLDEVKELLHDVNINKVWCGDRIHFTINLLAASTGMRMGEVQGLQIQHIHSKYVGVSHSFSRKYGIKGAKWNSEREIPIPSKASDHLQELISMSPFKDPEDLLFFGKDRRSPVHYKVISDRLYKAFEKIGIMPEERETRNISFHSWRYLYNSLMRGKIHDSKLRRLTGHKTLEMTEHYTKFNITDFKDVLQIQEEYFT